MELEDNKKAPEVVPLGLSTWLKRASSGSIPRLLLYPAPNDHVRKVVAPEILKVLTGKANRQQKPFLCVWVLCCVDGTRTRGLLVMSQASYQLLYHAP